VTPAKASMVEVFTDPRHNGGDDTAPAVVTRVHEDGRLSLRVLHDGPPVPPPHRYDRLTSVPFYPSRADAEAAHGQAWGHVPHPVPPFAAFPATAS
jgi:hypothetical protein